MEFLIRVAAADSDEALGSLHRWFIRDPEVNRMATFHLAATAGSPGEMGPTFDAIAVAVSDVIALGSLIVTYLSWRDSRARPPEVTIEREGVVVSLSSASPETVGIIVNELAELDSDNADGAA